MATTSALRPLFPWRPSRRRRLGGLLAVTAAVTAMILFSQLLTAHPAAAATSGFDDSVVPRVAVDPDRQSVELGVRFSVKRAGTIVGLEFYRTPSNRGPHTGTLWDQYGNALATVTFPAGTSTGWVTAPLTTPVAVQAGRTYTASYRAPHGGYPADEGYFDRKRTAGDLEFPRGAGVYTYGTGEFPTSNYRNTNYYVDVQFSLGSAPQPTPSPTPTATPQPTPTPTPTPTPQPTPTPTPTGTPPTGPGGGGLDLPQATSHGGSGYYAAFPKAAASGWSDPSFFPISVFLGKPEHAAGLRAAGINTYMGVEHDGSPISTVTSQGISVIAQQDEWTVSEIGTDPRVVGWLVSDECEMGLGGCTGNTDQARLAQQKAWADALRARNDGRFLHANFGNGVLGTFWGASTMSDHLGLVDVSSVDKYAYTSPHVQALLRDNPFWPAGKNPASASAYGWLQDRMETYATAKPNWVFVETGMPYLTENGRTTITGEQIEGAVWNAIIHGASGIAYFQHNNNGTCGNYSILECGTALRTKITAINGDVQGMATVLNSPTYVWDFGTGIDASLKASGGSAYIIAMTDGGTGDRSFTLPAALAGAGSIEVVGEGRSIPVSGGVFTDAFPAEHTHHIYRIALP